MEGYFYEEFVGWVEVDGAKLARFKTSWYGPLPLGAELLPDPGLTSDLELEVVKGLVQAMDESPANFMDSDQSRKQCLEFVKALDAMDGFRRDLFAQPNVPEAVRVGLVMLAGGKLERR